MVSNCRAKPEQFSERGKSCHIFTPELIIRLKSHLLKLRKSSANLCIPLDIFVYFNKMASSRKRFVSDQFIAFFHGTESSNEEDDKAEETLSEYI